MYHSKVTAGALFIASCYSAEMFNLVKESLNLVSFFVFLFVVRDLFRAVFFRWDYRFNIIILKPFSYRITIVGFIKRSSIKVFAVINLLIESLKLR